MSPGSRIDTGDEPASPPAAWAPHATLETLRRRAETLEAIRRFFASRGVLEVETPVVVTYPNADPHVHGLTTAVTVGGRAHRRYLRTSPEPAMKRLLAAGSGPIFQLGKVFRDGESGRWHNPEFTLLEWYRPGFDHRRLMAETEALVRALCPGFRAVRLPYRDAFRRWAGVDPWHSDLPALRRAAAERGAEGTNLDRDGCLDALLALAVQPAMREHHPGRGVFLHRYPVSQAALARLLPGAPAAAARFELFVEGIELANGYWELTDPAEQRRRFEAERARRQAAGEGDLPVDELLLGALRSGLPDCAGVALGVDRLQALVCGESRIGDVLTFPFATA